MYTASPDASYNQSCDACVFQGREEKEIHHSLQYKGHIFGSRSASWIKGLKFSVKRAGRHHDPLHYANSKMTEELSQTSVFSTKELEDNERDTIRELAAVTRGLKQKDVTGGLQRPSVRCSASPLTPTEPFFLFPSVRPSTLPSAIDDEPWREKTWEMECQGSSITASGCHHNQHTINVLRSMPRLMGV